MDEVVSGRAIGKRDHREHGKITPLADDLFIKGTIWPTVVATRFAQ